MPENYTKPNLKPCENKMNSGSFENIIVKRFFTNHIFDNWINNT